MATVVIMPKQGQSVESCILTELKKKKGDVVAIGDVLFSYETDKASFEEVSQVAGTVLDVFFADGDEIPVLTNVMTIGQPGESLDGFRPFGGKQTTTNTGAAVATSIAATSVASTAEVADSVVSQPTFGATSPVSPRARTLADKNAIQAETLVGTGPYGRVIERDVQAAIDARPKTTPLAKAIIKETGATLPETGSGLGGTAKAADIVVKNQAYTSDSEIKPLTNMRKLIAKTMHASLQNSAQLTHHLGADARNILNLRKKVKKTMTNGFPTDMTINDFVCFAVIRTLKQFPNVNAHFLGDSMRVFSKVHLGLAVDTERGLMVPAVKNADDLSLQGLSNQLKEVANACKKGGIAPDLLSSEAASFTVSNLGSYGVEIFTPVINLPQVAILGVNTIVPRPKDLGDGVYGFVPYMGLSLTYDHRALDGGEATRFLKQIAVEIENLDFSL
jgi:pyruvate dehydrogenase E2 component (dihydrolipoamide acetyltransferase)